MEESMENVKGQRQQETLQSASMLMPTDILNAQDLRILADLQSQLELLNDLRDVVLKGDIDSVKTILAERNVCVDVPCYDDEQDTFMTILGFVTSRRHLPNGTAIMQLLLDAGASVNARSDLGQTALILACKAKNVPAAKLLLGKGASLDAVDYKGWSALCAAASLDKNQSEQEKNGNHEYGMISAILCELLIWHNAAKNGEEGGAVPLQIAIEHNNYLAIQGLLQLGVSASQDPILHAALSLKRSINNTGILQALVNAGANPHITDEDGRIPLVVATNLYGKHDPRTRLIREATEQWETLFTQERPKDIALDHHEGKQDKDAAPLDGNVDPRGTAAGLQGEGKLVLITAQEFRNQIKLWQTPCRQILKDQYFATLMYLSLFGALFGADLWVVFDIPNNTALDIILVFIMICFCIEIIVQLIATVGYRYSFFFWCDLFGMFSVIADFSFVMDATLKDSEDGEAAIMLVARMVKLAARAGRFFRLIKLLKLLPGMQKHMENIQAGTARKISDNLHIRVSIRVSGIIILMVIIVSVVLVVTMRMVEQDSGLKTWPHMFVQNNKGVTKVMSQDMARFYRSESFFPYKIVRRYSWSASEPNWSWTDNECVLPRCSFEVVDAQTVEELNRNGEGKPRRPWNEATRTYHRKVDPLDYDTFWPAAERLSQIGSQPAGEDLWSSCRIHYNFTQPHILDSAMNMLLIFIVTCILLAFALELQKVVGRIVLNPLEELLNQVRNLASTMFQSVVDMSSAMKAQEEAAEHADVIEDDDVFEEEEDNAGEIGAFMETALLEKIAHKLVLLTDITVQKQGREQVDENIQQYTAATVIVAKKEEKVEEEEHRDEDFLRHHRVMLMQAGLTLEDIESFEFNTLDLDDFQTYAAIIWFVYGENMNLGAFAGDTLQINEKRLATFLEEISNRYINSNPYHNWLHAVDVAHCVYQFMVMVKAREYFSVSDRFSMLMAAVCHDVGHPGYNNPFLVESNDPLALKYNDKSPLENMHCSIMFECGFIDQSTAIFHKCTKQTYMHVRRVSIEAILHTDMVHHFPMVSELKLLQEENHEIIKLSHEEYWSTMESSLTVTVGGGRAAWEMPLDVVQFWKQSERTSLMRKLCLHAADVSNAFKPFPICRAWAQLVLEEFFLQGDKEKELGLTVQMLNDRNKVKKSFSQIGFIEFVLCPLYFCFGAIMPPVAPCAENLINNLRQWEAEWLEEHEPGDDEQAAVHTRIENLELAFQESQTFQVD